MRSKLMCIVVMAAVFSGSVLQVQAQEWRGSIHITQEGEEKPAGGTLELYWVGEETREGYRLTEEFGGGMVRREDSRSPALARWLAETAPEQGLRQPLSPEGTAVYEDLKQGLYLLMQENTADGSLPGEPLLIPVPYDGLWNMSADLKAQEVVTESPKTGQHPAPIIGAMGIVLAGMGIMVCVEKYRRK